MPIQVAFLRAMNTGGRRVKNDELCACFEAMGFGGVSAFLASGNVLFESGPEPEAEIEARIEQGLLGCLAYEVPTFVRRGAEVAALASRQPFPSISVAASAGNVQVALLAARPTVAARESALALAPRDDLLFLDGRDLFWLPKTTISDSKLNVNHLEKLLGPLTIRTQRTMTRLTARLGGR
jgi:uncharacterized protein (DUF1697 family)